MSDCLFCKIAAKELDSTILHETDAVLAFQDINPAAPTHVLVIPKRHVESAQALEPGDGDLLAELFQVVGEVASAAGVADGYRLVTNIGGEAGQTVPHLHFHVIGGRQLAWPPG